MTQPFVIMQSSSTDCMITEGEKVGGSYESLQVWVL
ncbi:MAG: hypothetical protein JWN52_4012 [Actinomycetia bacterium]|nr:hypothetical protein [Actinomycetes bacterium]